VGASSSVINNYVGRAKLAGLTWPLPPELEGDAELEARLFPREVAAERRPEPDWTRVHLELRKKHVTKRLLWEEYKEAEPEGYQYSAFCERYGRWAATVSPTMRQTHVAGEKAFMDFSGDGLEVVDPETGECKTAKLFLAVLGASNYTYAEPALSEDLPSWCGCHVRAMEYFEGSAEIWVPDNLKSGVTSPDLYEPDLNPTYADLARHYGAAVIPARVRKPRDKAKVEQGVLLAERWILAALRNHTFFSLAEVKAAVKPLLEKLNSRPMRKLGKSRRQLFEELDRPALKPLPARPYEFASWAKPKVAPDYHVAFEEHFYSVPFVLIGKQLEVRGTATMVEVLFNNRRVTSHIRSYRPGGYTTKAEHMPKAHQAYAEWTPERLIEWAKKTGPSTAAVVEEVMRKRAHPQQGFKACLGIMSLGKRYEGRLEAACTRALRLKACSYKSVAAILRNNLDRVTTEESAAQRPLPLHENIRGPSYYH
jgi:transposase